MTHQTKLKMQMVQAFIGVLFGLTMFSAFAMGLVALFGHVDGDIAQRDWAASWAVFFLKIVVGFFVAWAIFMASLWVAIKLRDR